MKKQTVFKAIACICVCVILLSILPFAMSFAASVSSEEDLIKALEKNDNINLASDITISSTTWIPYDYTAVLDGKGHVISGLSDALFDELGSTAVVKNVGLITNESISGRSILANTSNGTVSSCFAYGSISYTGNDVVGGLIAKMTGGTVSDSFSCVDITATNASYVGGLIGSIDVPSATNCVEYCYSSGAITANNEETYTAGLANLINGKVSNTYTSCQLLYESRRAKPSGVNGFYDNQMGLVRESLTNPGVSTRTLMSEKALSGSHFAVTSTSYPTLKSFYKSDWSPCVIDIIHVSSAAVAFSDISSQSIRFEPTETGTNNLPLFTARADYLTAVSYADKTNVNGLEWHLDYANCQILDTVPLTSHAVIDSYYTETSPDLLRSKFEFFEDVTDTRLEAKIGDYKRTWYLTVRSASNPHFPSNAANGDTESAPFEIDTYDKLDLVRHYSLIGSAFYKVTSDISCKEPFYPIEHFNGVFDGNEKIISDIRITSDTSQTNFGFFANTQSNAVVKNVTLKNVSIDVLLDGKNAVVGALIGTAGNGTTLENIVLYGTQIETTDIINPYKITSDYIAGGLVGSSNNLTITKALVSVEMNSLQIGGGIVGLAQGNTQIGQCGVTGYIVQGSKLGGIIGNNTGNASISNCYSSAAVVTDVSGAVVGGLLGANQGTSSAVINSYIAGLVDAPFAVENNGVAHSLVGSDNVTITNSFFDSVYAMNTDENLSQAKTTEYLTSFTPSDTVWTTPSDSYPQLSAFHSGTHAVLSALSTRPVYVQQYFPDTQIEDMTTGWIDDGIYNDISFLTPTPVTVLSDPEAEIYQSADGFGFEALSGQRRVMLRTVDSQKTGVRCIAFAREDLIPIRYTLIGQSDTRTYISLEYSTDSTTWHTYEVMSVSGNDSEVLYDIPKGSAVRFKIETEDSYKAYEVSVLSGGINYQYTSDDNDSTVFVPVDSDAKFDSSVNVTISLTANDAPWGLRRESH